MFRIFDEYDAPAFAHEFLHACGAIDLYRDEEIDYGVSADFNKYLEDTDSHDIMRWGDGSTKEINAVFSDLDAYYCGLADAPEEVERFNLEKSIFDTGE